MEESFADGSQEHGDIQYTDFDSIKNDAIENMEFTKANELADDFQKKKALVINGHYECFLGFVTKRCESIVFKFIKAKKEIIESSYQEEVHLRQSFSDSIRFTQYLHLQEYKSFDDDMFLRFISDLQREDPVYSEQLKAAKKIAILGEYEEADVISTKAEEEHKDVIAARETAFLRSYTNKNSSMNKRHDDELHSSCNELQKSLDSLNRNTQEQIKLSYETMKKALNKLYSQSCKLLLTHYQNLKCPHDQHPHQRFKKDFNWICDPDEVINLIINSVE